MKKLKKMFIPNLTEYKILLIVKEFNENSDYPLPYAVYRFLKGIVDEENVKYKNSDLFGAINSYSSKKISRHITTLLRHGFLEKIYDRKTDELYLKITNSATIFVLQKTDEKPLKCIKKERTNKKTIAHIENNKIKD
jgi:hypothetical protein